MILWYLLKQFIGAILIITGIFDALKYRWNSKKIKMVGTARGYSRKFINVAILNDLVRLVYSILIEDKYLILVSVIALVCMWDLFHTIYIYYPYRNRNKTNFKRPNIIKYTINSILPNKLRKHL